MTKKRLVLPDWIFKVLKVAIVIAALAGYMVYMGNSYAVARGLPLMFTW